MGSSYGSGYGYMWWVEGADGFTARGSGGHILAVFPARDLVMVIRADTYHDRAVSTRACMRLFEMVARAGQGENVASPRLVPASTETSQSPSPKLPAARAARYAGEIQMESGRKVVVAASADGVLSLDYGFGTYRLWPESDTRFIAKDS